MKTLLLNGSPNALQGNSQIFIDKFNEGFSESCEVICIRHKKPQEVASYMHTFECVLIVMPLYIHAMPGIVLKLFEAMEYNDKQKIGFIIQSGFSESSQSRFAVRILEHQVKRLGSEYVGTEIKPGAAGIKMMPEKANKQLFEQLRLLGAKFSKTNQFDKALIRQL